jgi:NRAMP (natural resistance-associated macrophage protein)-like metal ion transporter
MSLLTSKETSAGRESMTPEIQPQSGTSGMNLLSRLFYAFRRSSKALRLFCAIAGPGIIVMVADNDAGGITTYATTGAKYGLYLLWFLILLGPVAYYVQEMTVRLGAVTKRGHAEAIFTSFGRFWGWFSLLDLVLTDWLTMITEFIGMTLAMSIFGVPPWVTVICCWVIMGSMILSGRYWTWEKITLVFCVLNLIYIPAAFMVHPSVGDILKNSFLPRFPPGGLTNDLVFMLMANIGTTIAPWMLFFQQSSVVDKALKEKDITFGKLDTMIGALLTVVVAVVLIIVCGMLLNGVAITDDFSAADAAKAIMPQSKFIGTVMAIGFFDAGLLGAVCISLASSWAFGEVFGWAHSLNHKIKEAPWFYAYYFFDLLLAGTVVLIPKAPLGLITLFVQVIATTLMPAALVFLILLLNDRKTMGKYANTTWENFANITIVVAVIVTSTLYGISAVFPAILNDPLSAWQGTVACFQQTTWSTRIGGSFLAALILGVGLLACLGRLPVGKLIKPLAALLTRKRRMPVARRPGRFAEWFLRTPVGAFFRSTADQVRLVNRRFATPEIATTRFVKICLVSLRIYLFSLIGLMVFKFVIAATSHGSTPADKPAATPSVTQAAVAPVMTAGRKEQP